MKRLPLADAAGRSALGGAGSPEAIQRQYDAARDLMEAIAAAAPVSAGCLPLYRSALSYARAEIMQAEGVDRPSPALTQLGVRRAPRVRKKLDAARKTCRPASTPRDRPRHLELLAPKSGEAFFGTVRTRAIPGASRAHLYINNVI